MADALAAVGRRSAQGLVGAAVSGVATIATLLIASKSLGTGGAGYFFVGISLFAIVQGLISFGVDTGLQYWMPTATAASRRRITRLSLGVVGAAGVITSIALHLASRPVCDLLCERATGDQGVDVIRAVALVAAAGPLGEAALGALRGADRVVVALGLDRFVRPVLQVTMMIGAAIAGAGPVGMTLAWALPFVLVTVAALVAVSRLPHPWGGTAVTTREFVAYTWPRAIARGAQALVQRLDVLLLAAAVGIDEAGIYGTASRCMIAGVFVATAVQQMVQPQLRRAVVGGDIDEVRQMYAASTTWMVLVTWPVYLSMAVFAPAVMRLFGDGFERGSGALTILSLTMLVASGCGLVDVVLLMLGRSWLSTSITLGALAVNVVLNLVLDPHFGMTGAAIAWAAAILTTNLLPLRQVMRHGIHPGGRPLRTAMLCALTAVLLPLLAARLAWGTSLALLLPSLAIALALYAGGVGRHRRVLMLDRLTSGLRGRQPRPTVLPRPVQVGSE